MIMVLLIPVAVFCFIHVGIHGWRRSWKNATLYLFAGIIALLTYTLWGKSQEMNYMHTQIEDLQSRLSETGSNKSTHAIGE